MPKEINVICVGDIRHRYDGNIIQHWDFDYNDKEIRIDFSDGSFVQYYKKNIICVEFVSKNAEEQE